MCGRTGEEVVRRLEVKELVVAEALEMEQVIKVVEVAGQRQQNG